MEITPEISIDYSGSFRIIPDVVVRREILSLFHILVAPSTSKGWFLLINLHRLAIRNGRLSRRASVFSRVPSTLPRVVARYFRFRNVSDIPRQLLTWLCRRGKPEHPINRVYSVYCLGNCFSLSSLSLSLCFRIHK